MIFQTIINGQIWFEFLALETVYISNSLAGLLEQLPYEFKKICLTQLN